MANLECCNLMVLLNEEKTYLKEKKFYKFYHHHLKKVMEIAVQYSYWHLNTYCLLHCKKKMVGCLCTVRLVLNKARKQNDGNE
jgi:hypothetical protein